MIIVSICLIVVSWIFIFFGLGAIFSLKNLYSRIISAATIETVASLFLLIGLMFATQTFASILRFGLLVIFLIITGPISSHVNIRSAFLIGIPYKKEGH